VNELRALMRRFPSGVTVVTTMLDGRPKGFTATAFASVSLEPPMVLICVNRRARTHPMISQAGIFCVNLLPLEARELAVRFAERGDTNPFAAPSSPAASRAASRSATSTATTAISESASPERVHPGR
jgi:flavin reductase (DIM6/NTAB) family NADH-FMN oxidoreductase RutF